MPHKRAKRSVREQSRKEKGADLAPGKQALSTEAIPKSVSRVLDAARIRGAWSDKKRKLMEDGEPQRNDKRRKLGNEHGQAREGANKGRTKVGTSSEIRIKPGESIQHFNRRVEDDMRPLVKSAMQSSLAVSRNARKAEVMAKSDKKNGGKGSNKSGNVTPPIRQPSPSPPPKHADRPKEFKTLSSSAPRRLNDIAQAPPEFKKLPRGAASTTPGSSKRDGVVSMAQKLIMEEERSKAIARYRKMKADRRQNGDMGNDRNHDGDD